MANIDNPHGLRSLGVTTSGGQPEVEEFLKLVGYATAIYRGDAVARAADGAVQIPATPGTTYISGVSLEKSPASTAATMRVITSPDCLFEAQADGTLLEADMGLNANLIYGSGNATTGISGHEINSATEATTATLDVKLRKKLALPDNEYGDYVRIEIVINKHRMNPGVAGV
jgi:hypothetical protein